MGRGRWYVAEREVTGPDSLDALARELSTAACGVVRGELVAPPGARLSTCGTWRYADGSAVETHRTKATFRAAERQWLALDVDKLETPSPLADALRAGEVGALDRAAEYVRASLPAEWREVACTVSWTASAGVPKDGCEAWATLSARVWLWLAEPVEQAALDATDWQSRGLDPSTMKRAQLVFTRAPLFLDERGLGLADPLAGRRHHTLAGPVAAVPGWVGEQVTVAGPARAAGGPSQARGAVRVGGPTRRGDGATWGALRRLWEAHDGRELADVLAAHGYVQTGGRWLSPFSRSGTPGVTILDDGGTERAYSHHTSGCPLADGRAHDALSAWVTLEHGGSAVEARAALERLERPSTKALDETPRRTLADAERETREAVRAALTDGAAPTVLRVTPGVGKTWAAVKVVARLVCDLLDPERPRRARFDASLDRAAHDGVLWVVQTDAQAAEAETALRAALVEEAELRGWLPSVVAEVVVRRPVRTAETCGALDTWRDVLRVSPAAADGFCRGCPMRKDCPHVRALRTYRETARHVEAADGARIEVVTQAAALVDQYRAGEDGERVRRRPWAVVVDESPWSAWAPCPPLDPSALAWTLDHELVLVTDADGSTVPRADVLRVFEAWAGDGREAGPPPPAEWTWTAHELVDEREAEVAERARSAGGLGEAAAHGTARALVEAARQGWQSVSPPKRPRGDEATDGPATWATTLPGPVRALPSAWARIPLLVLDATAVEADAALLGAARDPLAGGAEVALPAPVFVRIDAPLAEGSRVVVLPVNSWRRVVTRSGTATGPGWQRARWRTAHELVDEAHDGDVLHFTSHALVGELADAVRGPVEYYGRQRGSNEHEGRSAVVLDAFGPPRHVVEARAAQYRAAGVEDDKAQADAERGLGLAELVQAAHRVRAVRHARTIYVTTPARLAVCVVAELGADAEWATAADEDTLDRATWGRAGAWPEGSADVLARWLVASWGGGDTQSGTGERVFLASPALRVTPPLPPRPTLAERARNVGSALLTHALAEWGWEAVAVATSRGSTGRTVYVPRAVGDARRNIALAQLRATPDTWAEWDGERIALSPSPLVVAFHALAERIGTAARGYPLPTAAEVAEVAEVAVRTVKRWRSTLGAEAVEAAWAEAVAEARAEVEDALDVARDVLAAHDARMGRHARTLTAAARPSAFLRALDAGGWLALEREVAAESPGGEDYADAVAWACLTVRSRAPSG